MKNNPILSLFRIFFLFSFLFLVFDVVALEKNKSNEAKNFRVKSHLEFNKKISGKAFAIDGDSLRVNKKEIRLFGIDAPEYSQKCLDNSSDEYECGQVSHKFLISLVGGKLVDCFYAEKDKYNRYLSKCFIGDISINEEIIKNGMGVIYNFTESDKKLDELEADAKKKKLGIWKGSFELPKDYRKHNKNFSYAKK